MTVFVNCNLKRVRAPGPVRRTAQPYLLFNMTGSGIRVQPYTRCMVDRRWIRIVSSDATLQYLEFMETLVDLSDFESATGIVIELQTSSGYSQLIGPYRKDTVDVFEAVERLRSEEDSDDVPNTYAVKLLFPTSFAASRGEGSPSLDDREAIGAQLD
jgi:hypothetical protein